MIHWVQQVGNIFKSLRRHRQAENKPTLSERFAAPYRLLWFVPVVGVLTLAFTYSVHDNYKTWFTESYKVKAPFIPKDVYFAGERVPLEEPDIRERLDRELMATVYWQSNTMMLLKRSKKYFPVMEQILAENNIPADFKYLCVAESGLSNATSPSGAKGFWQLLEGTAKPYGLEINNHVDERFHLEKATRAACAYFKESYGRFANWTLTAASYNRGMGGTVRDVAYQYAGGFYDLYMNDETSRYIFRILAYKLIFENPEMYGYYLEQEDYYSEQPRIVVSVDTAISNLSAFAKDNGTNYKWLKLLNPWLRERDLPNKSRKVYQIELRYKE